MRVDAISTACLKRGMTSRRQIEANRRNAARSTGPSSPEGRAASSANALRHGILSNRFIADHENYEVFTRLLTDLVAEYEPETALESLLVERLAMLFWRERRLATAEAEQANLIYANSSSPFGSGSRNVPIANQYLVGRYQGMLGRQIKETLRDLRDERDRRLRQIGQPVAEETNGFEDI